MASKGPTYITNVSKYLMYFAFYIVTVPHVSYLILLKLMFSNFSSGNTKWIKHVLTLLKFDTFYKDRSSSFMRLSLLSEVRHTNQTLTRRSFW